MPQVTRTLGLNYRQVADRCEPSQRLGDLTLMGGLPQAHGDGRPYPLKTLLIMVVSRSPRKPNASDELSTYTQMHTSANTESGQGHLNSQPFIVELVARLDRSLRWKPHSHR